MTAFVILHYRAIDTTRSCVKSIRALAGDKHIVIVDNASPNGTGAVLAEEFAASPDVTVLLHGKNDGFARGNNVGVRWVYEHLDADFTVVLNNDVEIPQHDFIPQIARIYAQHPFDLLGPDIVSVFSGIHQSPKTLHGCTLESVRHKRACVARSKNPILLLLSSGEKNSPAIWRLVQIRNRKKQHIDTTRPAEGVVLHGSCVIFSQNVHVLRDGDPRLDLPPGGQRRALRPVDLRAALSVRGLEDGVPLDRAALKIRHRLPARLARCGRGADPCIRGGRARGSAAGKHRRARGRLSAQKGGTAP